MPERHLTALRALIFSLFLACAPGIAEHTVPVEPPIAFSESGDAPLVDRWWTAFDSAELDTLVERALRDNFSLESAWHRLRAARAVVDRESSGYLPEVEGELRAEETRPENPGDDPLRLGLSAEYELDLWGRIRSAVAAERFRARAERNDYRTAALSLSAEVVLTWHRLLEARAQLELFERQIRTNTEALGLIRARFGSGQVRSVDILRQTQLLESTREQKIEAESRVQVLEHRLAVLLGRAPRESLDYAARPLPALPPLPSAGLPSDLVQRRPDVQRAYDLLRAADRDLAVALTNRYPRLVLTGSGTSTGDTAGDLFEGWIRTFTAGLVGPLFDGGARGAEVDRSRARLQQQVAVYGQTVLTAFREVEDALVQERNQVERIRSLEAQVALARQSYDQLRLEYLNGITGYLDVLTALTAEQRLRRDLIASRRLLLEYRVALYRALAGGFDTSREAAGDLTSAHAE